jgi:hypothetical protein
MQACGLIKDTTITKSVACSDPEDSVPGICLAQLEVELVDGKSKLYLDRGQIWFTFAKLESSLIIDPKQNAALLHPESKAIRIVCKGATSSE